MAEKFAPLTAGCLLAWILAEEKRCQIFGIHRDLFFKGNTADPFRMTRFGRLLETPLGVAAGPHTQLAQNIFSAWLCGARFIELKTVQTLDRLEVRKPCIAVAEAGYNCEWSQELTLDESFDQYLAAWVVLHALKWHLHGSFRGDPGFIFNFSVGYNLAGLMKPNMQRFFEKISSCRSEKEAVIKELAPLFPGINKIDIPDRVSDNVTLSTMHGCPPEEIEKIGLYLLNEKKLHTTVKLNPTLLGPEALRGLLNDRLGYKVRIPDQAFAHDLKYDSALDLLRSLQACADKNGLNFGVKLTNTLECLNDRGLLPEAEKTVYMSGRPLHPIAVALARRLQDDFAGRLDISYSAGADCFNAVDLLACGLKPLTVCSDLLRPGGYARLGQYLEEIRRGMNACRATSLDKLAMKQAKIKDPAGAILKNLKNYEAALAKDESCHAPLFPASSFKGKRPLDWFDCAAAPCRETCAAGQDVSQYLYWVGRGDADRAKAVVWETNPLPAVCGMVCDQKCRSRCTRGLYDRALAIRSVKRFAVENGKIPAADPASLGDATRIAVVGAGPAGLAAARELARGGFWVEVFEANNSAGGLAATVIPGFRLNAAALDDDVSRLKKMGVIFHFDQTVDPEQLHKLLDTFQLVFVACGAGRGRKMLIPEEDAAGVYDALEFLAAVKRGEKPALGRQILVIGGGNSAMDAARTARHLCGADGQVTVVYRRSLTEMPAVVDEIREALTEGVRIMELTAPLRIETADGREWALLCSRMELRKADGSGRPRPVPIFGSEFELTGDAVIVAIGQEKSSALLAGMDWKLVGDDGRTTHPRLFIIGDARRGPSSLIQSIADGCQTVDRIMEMSGRTINAAESDPVSRLTWSEHQLRRSRRERIPARPKTASGTGLFAAPAGLDAKEARHEAKRCLQCDDFCQLCVSACPNRALVAFAAVPGRWPILRGVKYKAEAELSALDIFRLRQKYQLVHVDDFCNACGNCATFCPTAGAPYKDKPHIYLHQKNFAQAENGFFLEPCRPGGVRVLHFRSNGERQQLRQYPDRLEFENRNCLLKLGCSDFSFLAADWRHEADPAFDGKLLAQMAILLEFLPLFLQGDKIDV